jgi:transcriptional regulator with XRE-family HTH domain
MFSKTARQEMGKLIKKSRTEAGLTQHNLATKLGYKSPQFVSNFERAESLPPIAALPKIARATKTKYSDFADILRRDFDRSLKSVENHK